MPLQTINIGASANDGTRDPVRTAFDKVNDNFQAVSGGMFNVKNLASGAVGDGVRDDTAAIQAAVDALKALNSIADIARDFPTVLYFPVGKYKTTDSIDFTGVKGVSWVIEGNGSVIMAHCSGKPVFDYFHSARYHIHDIMIAGDTPDKPSYGIQMGRAVAGEQLIAVNYWYTNRYDNANCTPGLWTETIWENITSAFVDVNGNAVCRVLS